MEEFFMDEMETSIYQARHGVSPFNELSRQVFVRCWRWQGFSLAFENLNPFLNNLAKFAVNLRLVLAVAAGADDAGALAYEALVFLRPFDDF